jgi:hypothetical protein
MKTRADEIKAQIAAIDKDLADAESKLAQKRATVSALESYVDQKYARRWQLEGQLEREQGSIAQLQEVAQ